MDKEKELQIINQLSELCIQQDYHIALLEKEALNVTKICDEKKNFNDLDLKEFSTELSTVKILQTQMIALFKFAYPENKEPIDIPSWNDFLSSRKTLLLRKSHYMEGIKDLLRLHFSSSNDNHLFQKYIRDIQDLDISKMTEDECENVLGKYMQFLEALHETDPQKQTEWVIVLGGQFEGSLITNIFTKNFKFSTPKSQETIVENNNGHIRRDNSKDSAVTLDSISYNELRKEELNPKKEAVTIAVKESASEERSYENNKNNPIIKQFKENHPSKNLDVFDLLEERGDTFFQNFSLPVVRHYMDVAKSEKSQLSQELLSIANSLDYAIMKNHEISPADYKIQENVKKLRRIIKANKKSKVAANMLGVLYYQCKSDRLALETYKEGDDNESAFVIAENINSKDYMELFACRHLIENEELNPYILKWLILRLIEKDDYSIVTKIDTNKTAPSKIAGYCAFIKAILLANGIDYDSMLDYENTRKSLSVLIDIFSKENIGSSFKMAEYIPEIYEPIIPIEKPTSECPTYMAAKKVREQEKKLAKAEKLYIEAIQKNERPGAAAADLVGLMMQRHDFSKAAEYLGQYGSKYMREEAYRNVRAQLVSMDSKLARTTSQSEKVEVKQDYFLLAQKAELEQKDLQKAITYYKEAIRRSQRLTGSVPNLVSIYTRLEMYDEALNLLDDIGKRYMENTKYLNLKLSVLGAAKDSKYKKEIEDTYKQVIAISNSKEKRTDLLFSEAYLLNQIGEHNEAIDLFTQCLNKVDNKAYLVPEKAKRQRINALLGLCIAYFKLEDIEKAIDYATEILKLQPDNEFAKSVISGQVNEELKYGDNTIGVSRISEYIVQRINKLSLENELKNKTSIREGEFTGTAEEAERIINAIIGSQVRTSVNDEIQSNNYFAIAKIIRQILDRDEEIKPTTLLSERNYQLQVAIGSYFYGNYRLYRTELTHNFDTARYCFFEAISMFQDAEKTHKCWAAATVRYIETFFCTTSDIKDGAKIYYLFKDYEKEYEEQILKVMQGDIVAPVEEFVVGMLEMLTYNSRVRSFVLSNILNKAMEGRILDVLGSIGDEQIPDSLTEKQFNEIWDITSKKYYVKRKNFLRTIEETIESIFIFGQLQDNYNRFNESEFQAYLNQTDREYVEDLRMIFAALLRYNEESEFDYKADNLGRADDIRKRLEEKIADNPTYISFEKILPMLTQLQAKIFKESAQLYGDSEPDIKVELSGDCSIDEVNLIVRAPISYTNKNNVQNADNVSIRIEGENIEVINDEQLRRGFLAGNGKPQGEIVIFKVTKDIIKSQAFTVNFIIQYQYKKNMTELEDASVDIQLPIPLYSVSAFEPIDNKFEPYRNGSEVKEASMFYGRDGDIESIIQQISDESGNVLRGRCLALYGQTRTGKSSLLYHLERRLRSINEEGNVIVNVGSIGEENLSGNDITEFLYTLLDELNHEINSKHPRLKEILTNNGIEIDTEKLLENPERAQLLFNNVFKNINRCVEDGNYTYNIIVMIDEFTYIYDWIRRGIMTDRIMKFWKSFIQNNEIFAIIIGQDHMMKFVGEKQFTNDFGSTDLRKVTYLPEEDAKKLMYEPIMLVTDSGERVNRYQADALDRLYELTAGSAFLIMNLCAGLVDYLNETHTVYTLSSQILGLIDG